MADWSEKDLEYWDEKIREKAAEFGLRWYPQEFEICDHLQMLSSITYNGIPSHYPHWSFGKSYEKTKTLYDYGVSGLPYEMVIASNPSIAYLMRDNSLCLQILTMAHVYGHNDFFKNNFTHGFAKHELVAQTFKVRANRVRSYIEDPSIGQEKVENLLDAAHALQFQCRRNLAVKKLSREEEERRVLEMAEPQPDPFRRVHKPPEYKAPDLKKVPLEPEEDMLLFIRDHNPYLSEWEKDLLTIVHEEAQYFMGLMETKIMNEGWASYWHREILNSLKLPDALQLEFIQRHNQVVRPFPRGINPYHLGLKLWDSIYYRYGGKPRVEADRDMMERMTGEDEYALPSGYGVKTPQQALFETREVDRDVSFLRRWFTEFLMREMDMFQYEPKEGNLVISKVSDKKGWREVKETLLKNVGAGTIPVIKIEDADHDHNRTLYLKHSHDGRDLQLEYAEKTSQFIYQLWGHDVILETTLNGKKALLSYNDKGFATKPLK